MCVRVRVTVHCTHVWIFWRWRITGNWVGKRLESWSLLRRGEPLCHSFFLDSKYTLLYITWCIHSKFLEMKFHSKWKYFTSWKLSLFFKKWNIFFFKSGYIFTFLEWKFTPRNLKWYEWKNLVEKDRYTWHAPTHHDCTLSHVAENASSTRRKSTIDCAARGCPLASSTVKFSP